MPVDDETSSVSFDLSRDGTFQSPMMWRIEGLYNFLPLSIRNVTHGMEHGVFRIAYAHSDLLHALLRCVGESLHVTNEAIERKRDNVAIASVIQLCGMNVTQRNRGADEIGISVWDDVSIMWNMNYQRVQPLSLKAYAYVLCWIMESFCQKQ